MLIRTQSRYLQTSCNHYLRKDYHKTDQNLLSLKLGTTLRRFVYTKPGVNLKNLFGLHLFRFLCKLHNFRPQKGFMRLTPGLAEKVQTLTYLSVASTARDQKIYSMSTSPFLKNFFIIGFISSGEVSTACFLWLSMCKKSLSSEILSSLIP